jgi:palmitoyltransferase ZDHHC13/17
VHAVDTARDSATHWAAYKGSIAVLGLLSFYDTRQLSQPDAYGQTPLHLAALRGHVSVVRYILQKLVQGGGDSGNSNGGLRLVKDVLHLKDQNGRTPYELAVHKDRGAVAAVLQAQALALQPHYQSWQAQLKRSLTVEALKQLCRPRTCKVWLGLPEVDDMDESPKFPFYYVIAQICMHLAYYYIVFVPLFDPVSGVLWDYLGVHVLNTFLVGVTSYCLWKCHTTDPGRLDASYPGIDVWRRLYEQTLDAFASADEAVAAKAAAVQLCHTCHIARPARSKHDRFSRACILQFDHHCPFVGTTIGLYNYKWFFLFLIAITTYLVSFLVILAVYYSRMKGSNSTMSLLLGLFLGLHVFFPGFMLVYHVQLVIVNLTTNEHINTSRYDYFWETSSSSNGSSGTNRRFYNPWNKGCWGNILDRFQPGDHCYLLPEQDRASEYEMLLMSSNNRTNAAPQSSKNHHHGHGIV